MATNVQRQEKHRFLKNHIKRNTVESYTYDDQKKYQMKRQNKILYYEIIVQFIG